MKKKLLSMGAGILIGVLGDKILKSNAVKKVAVSTVAGGLKAKESLDKTIEKVKESTEDIVAEAKVKNESEEKAREEKEETIEKLAEEK
ncbi:vacuolar-type H+-ATPase subunit H [Peptoniphilus koenoeneniae]|uniref:Vacuolar-type H+-ATPase subunit H n=1 Tax=Peptoniphilus koenoeneniae TaxID=507751 RepID=A0ABU0AU88_9FIRM|nr:DUF1490 domain-containing protein [Peptoniphilus koenoeneniae]ERT56553.1 hypothetical protein HMPREF1253_0066 [Peptoniphilus sp. BV3C26]MDQ0274832.1 vacuolar-type H+-ATPase subunit H [Peptoniphilus koenoeneniae]